MIANGKANGNAKSSAGLFRQVFDADMDTRRRLQSRNMETKSSYYAGESDRLNPVPMGVDPYGTDADTHYRTERNYFLMVERGRSAVRNHPLVETGVNRLGANLRLGDFTLDVDSGDEQVDADQKADWLMFAGETQAGQNLCDYEGRRSFSDIACQSFFSQVVDGDVIHIPLFDGCLQTFEAHHLRNPFGHYSTGEGGNGIVHGVQIRNNKVDGYWLTPHTINVNQTVSRRTLSRFFPASDRDGNRLVYHIGFMHRFAQRRGISRFSPPREAMNGFEDISSANIKSMLKKALIALWMETVKDDTVSPFASTGSAKSGVPQAGPRTAETPATPDAGGLTSFIIEVAGMAGQVWDVPEGKQLHGMEGSIPTPQWFEHASLMLTMLSVNLDIPLMFLLLDGSKVNFHGGRMITDQIRLRFSQLQKNQRQGLWNPTYEMRTRQRLTPGHPLFDRQLFAAVQSGRANPLKYVFRPMGWPYVKPLEDAAADDLAERRNLKSMRDIQAKYGVDLDDHRKIVIPDRRKWFEAALTEATSTVSSYPEADLDVKEVAMLYAYGTDNSGVQLSIASEQDTAEVQPAGAADD